MLDCSHPQPISTIDQWRASLKFLDEISEEASVVIVVYLFNTPFGDYAGAVCVDYGIFSFFFCAWHSLGWNVMLHHGSFTILNPTSTSWRRLCHEIRLRRLFFLPTWYLVRYELVRKTERPRSIGVSIYAIQD